MQLCGGSTCLGGRRRRRPRALATRSTAILGETAGRAAEIARSFNLPGPVMLRVNPLVRARGRESVGESESDAGGDDGAAEGGGDGDGDGGVDGGGGDVCERRRASLIAALASSGVPASRGRLSPWAVRLDASDLQRSKRRTR